MLLAVRISSYGCTWEVWRALKKLELFSAAPRATLTLLSCSPNYPHASITRYTHAKHEPILNLRFSGHKCKFLSFHNSQKRYVKNTIKYRSLPWKPWSLVRIFIYWTWPIGSRQVLNYVISYLAPPYPNTLHHNLPYHIRPYPPTPSKPYPEETQKAMSS